MGCVVDFLELKGSRKVSSKELSVVDNSPLAEAQIGLGGYIDGEWYTEGEIEWIEGMKEMEQFHKEVTSKEIWTFEDSILKVRYRD